MSPSLFILWAVAGWCITGWPRLRLRWPLRKPVPRRPSVPFPEPPPYPWLITRIVGVVGGVIGGWVFTEVFVPQPNPWITAGPSSEPWMLVVAAATTVGAFLGASLLTDLDGLVRGSGKVTRDEGA